MGGTLRRRVRAERFYAESRTPIGHDYIPLTTRYTIKAIDHWRIRDLEVEAPSLVFESSKFSSILTAIRLLAQFTVKL